MDMNSSVLFMLKDGFSTSSNKESINCSHYEYNIPALLFMALMFHKISSTGGNSRFYFHEVSKICEIVKVSPVNKRADTVLHTCSPQSCTVVWEKLV